MQNPKPGYVEPPNIPAQSQVVAVLTITLTADGNVAAQCKAPNPMIAIGMIEQAKLDLHAKFKEQANGIQAAAGPLLH